MGNVNWASITAKLNRVVARKVEAKVSRDLALLESEFISAMDSAVVNSPRLTGPESERVSLVPFTCTGKTFGSTQNFGGIVKTQLKLFFDFTGDKTMVSLSPNKSVYNLVALFNNGYASNNVSPDAPIRGMWHGHELVIYPKGRMGANFIGRAIQQFKDWCSAYYPAYKLSFKVNPVYNSNTN